MLPLHQYGIIIAILKNCPSRPSDQAFSVEKLATTLASGNDLHQYLTRMNTRKFKVISQDHPDRIRVQDQLIWIFLTVLPRRGLTSTS